MNASCGTRSFRMRASEMTAAPTSVNVSENRYKVSVLPGSLGSYPSRMPYAAPSAASWAIARSTKMTLRLRTWIPRYPWMPVTMRHIASGAHHQASSRLFTARLSLQGFDQAVERVVDELEVVVRAGLPARLVRDNRHLGARLLREPPRVRRVVEVVDDDQLDLLRPDGLHQVAKVRRPPRRPPRLPARAAS